MIRLLALAVALAASVFAQDLRIFAIDTEGGKATLYVAPSGESMLIDTGYDGNDNRDARRIAQAAQLAGVKRINHLVMTHFHSDHIGGLKQLVAVLPVDHIYDHGATVEPGPAFEAYATLRKIIPYTTLHAGDTIPVQGFRVDVVSADGKAIRVPMPGAGKTNPECATYKPITEDKGENAHSLAMVITFGKLRISDLGDLHWNQEFDLACPVNKIGQVGLYMTTHHGTATSGHPQIVRALHPTAALMNNGATKGGSVQAWTTIHESPGLQDIWQLHYSKAGGAEHNAPERFLANPDEACKGEWIEVTGRRNGSFTIRNHRNGFARTYKK